MGNNTKNIMIVGVGGQGTLLTSRILGGITVDAGYDVKLSEVHGMAQRGGSVVTFVRYGEKVAEPIVEPVIQTFVKSIVNEVKEENRSSKTKTIPFTSKDILNVMVQATKSDKKNIADKWGVLRQYQNMPTFARATNLLIDAQPAAVCKNGIVFVYKYESQANEINLAFNQKQVQKLLKEIYMKDFVVFGLSEDAFVEVKQQFISLMQRQALPSPFPIDIEKYDVIDEEKEEIKEEKASLASEIFGSLLEGEDE